MAAAAAEEAANSMFARPKCSTTTSPNLYVANCGPTVGLSLETISSVFSAFGRVTGVHAADDTGARVIVCFSDTTAAQAAYQALNGNPCPQLRGRTLRMRFSLPKLPAKVSVYHPIHPSFIDKFRSSLGNLRAAFDCYLMMLTNFFPFSELRCKAFSPPNPQ